MPKETLYDRLYDATAAEMTELVVDHTRLEVFRADLALNISGIPQKDISEIIHGVNNAGQLAIAKILLRRNN